MKTLRTILAVIMLLSCIISASAFAEDEPEVYTVSFVAELSNPAEIPDGYGLLSVGTYSYMAYTMHCVSGTVLSEDSVPEISFLGDGVTFEGWDKTPVGHTVASDITFTAKFNNDGAIPAFFRVERSANSLYPQEAVNGLVAPGTSEEVDGKYKFISMLKAGETLTESTIPEVQFPTGSMLGHDGWNTDPNGTVLTEPVEFVYSVYTVHRVMFIAKRAEICDVQLVRTDCAAQAPAVPEVDGCLFLGWDKDYSVITSDMDIYALQYAYGDVNMDEFVNTGDAVRVLRSTVGLEELSENEKLLADMNNDSAVNTADAVAILRAAVGL